MGRVAETPVRGDVQFVINIPVNFSRDLLRGLKPAVLVEADASRRSSPISTLDAAKDVQEEVALTTIA